MDVSRALDQIAEIHAQIAKGEIYRGYQSLPIAASGVIGLVAAWLQPRALGLADPVGFVLYWSAVAGCAVLVGGSEIVYNYAVHEDEAGRKRTRQVVGQFLPTLAAGAAMTACIAHLGASFVPLLPGMWALCFGFGTFASRPYLTRASGWVAWFYSAAGAVLLWNAQSASMISGWAVGGTFGAGQLLAAFVLWFSNDHTDLADWKPATITRISRVGNRQRSHGSHGSETSNESHGSHGSETSNESHGSHGSETSNDHTDLADQQGD